MRAKRVTIDDLRKLCPRYGRHTNCKYWFPYKSVYPHVEYFGSRGGRYNMVDYTKLKLVLKKGIKGECFLEMLCFDCSMEAKNG